jgi:hypothetical protein
MDSNQAQQFDPVPDERQIRLTIMRDMTKLYEHIGEVRSSWEELMAAEGGARGARLVSRLLHEVTVTLDDVYRRSVNGALHPLERAHWLPVLEFIRQELRKASATLSVLPGARLERAVQQLRRSMAGVESAPVTPAAPPSR